jgi:hypothetical protein
MPGVEVLRPDVRAFRPGSVFNVGCGGDKTRKSALMLKDYSSPLMLFLRFNGFFSGKLQPYFFFSYSLK